jgi:hypothetical protein
MDGRKLTRWRAGSRGGVAGHDDGAGGAGVGASERAGGRAVGRAGGAAWRWWNRGANKLSAPGGGGEKLHSHP